MRAGPILGLRSLGGVWSHAPRPVRPESTKTWPCRAGSSWRVDKRNNRRTSAKAAKAASKMLSNPKATKTANSAAPNASSQTLKRK